MSFAHGPTPHPGEFALGGELSKRKCLDICVSKPWCLDIFPWCLDIWLLTSRHFSVRSRHFSVSSFQTDFYGESNFLEFFKKFEVRHSPSYKKSNSPSPHWPHDPVGPIKGFPIRPHPATPGRAVDGWNPASQGIVPGRKGNHANAF